MLTTILVGTILGVALGLAVLEGALRLRGDAGEHEPNAFIRALRGAARGGDRYVDTLFPHPYLGWVHHRNPPGGMDGINNVGLFGPDFPCDKNPSRFVVLLTGGSVAAQFAQPRGDRPCYLEEILNRDWVTPDGRPVVVLDGAAGAWKQPQQAILFLMYCDVVDAVVTLDGWNEHYALVASNRLELPATNFHLTNPVATGSHRQIVASWVAGGLERWVRRHPLASRSRAAAAVAYAVRRALHARFVEPAAEAERPTTVESLFALPASYGPAERFHHAVRSYAKYLVAMDAVARRWGVRTAFFLQPAPAIDKPLTDEERAVVGDLSYGPRYAKMVEELLRLRRLGVPVTSLTDVFAGCAETVYADWCHVVRDSATGESPGYHRMAERVATQLAAEWGLAPRASTGPASDVGVRATG